MLDDLQRGKGRLSVSMTDMNAFRLGENIATTPGKVVFQNEMIQLIQYEPMTEHVHKTPLLIIPPWINKFYVLDLQPKNSFIRWCVEQGHTVFVISWINPDARLRDKSFEHYSLEGLIEAMAAVEKATSERAVNCVGYCLGGTLLASTLAYLAAKGDDRVKGATYFVTLVDFVASGDMSVFINSEQLAALETRMNEKGYLDAQDMATSFNMLRANDLIWSFVVGNYLLGKEPVPFDLLYWNSDATRMPAAMHSVPVRMLMMAPALCLAMTEAAVAAKAVAVAPRPLPPALAQSLQPQPARARSSPGWYRPGAEGCHNDPANADRAAPPSCPSTRAGN